MRIQVEEVFHEVADLPVEARLQHFDARQVGVSTRRDVEALLAFDQFSDTSLERDLGQFAEGALARFDGQEMRCGQYRLGSLLGRGGMGTVYLADRLEGVFGQRVAVKLPRAGVDDPYTRQRFLTEGRILSTLSHPNIARLLDAGHRDDGQPYLVMEYVKGKPIDAWSAGVGVRHKIAVFLKVCAAVGYLHQNSVVHRDLKPANILVTNEDEPMLLDFGIAKLLGLSTDSTVTGMRMLTPDYASPEQVASGPVSKAMDIYSLGALLYKLLTGTSPHQVPGGSLEAVVHANSTGTITPPAKLVPELKGDLETIVMKALRKEPRERYATAEQFSNDLENYLAGRPIRAGNGATWYETRKFFSLYWFPLGAATVAVTSLCASVALVNRERAIMHRQFRKFAQAKYGTVSA